VGASIARCTWHVATAAGPVTIWPEAFRLWAHTAGAAAVTSIAGPILADRSATTVATTPPPAGDLAIVQPLGGAVYLFDPTLRSEYQTLALRARGAGDGALRWSVDGVTVGDAIGPDAVRWPLTRGAHVVTVEDAAGRSASTRIVVR
jgi:membrane carboxypeptidase/penicillin-binding protein PbpC